MVSKLESPTLTTNGVFSPEKEAIVVDAGPETAPALPGGFLLAKLEVETARVLVATNFSGSTVVAVFNKP
jgi:hypothetical protein